MKNILLFLFLILNVVGNTQQKKPVFITLSSKGGFMMAHRPFMAHLIQKNTLSFELSFNQQQNDQSYYSLKPTHPLNGLSVEVRNFGYDAVLGYAISLFWYQNFVVFQTKNNLCLDFKMGTGLAYLTKKYDKNKNPKNNAIGSHFNAKVAFNLSLTKFSPNYHYGLGIELVHFSNGAIQMPNLGLNGLSVTANFGYNLQPRIIKDKSNVISKKLDKSNQKHYLLLEGITSVGEVYPIPLDAKKYMIFAGRFSYIKPINKSWNYEIAFDGVYNFSNLHKYYDSTFTPKDVPQVGIYIGMSYNYYKTQINFGIGYYIVDIINPLGRIYNRIGYRYYFKPNWFALFNVRANFGKADFFEFGLGYKFNK